MNRILNLTANSSIDSIGGKAKNLLKLEELGIRVPEWLVLPQEHLLEQTADVPAAQLADKRDLELKVDKTIIAEIAQFFGADFKDQTFAVRSSAIDEDGLQFSFAGQFESHLHVGPEDLAHKIEAVWRSAFSERLIAYRKKNNLELRFGIAVIVQRMVDSDVSGVAFGANPLNGDRKTKIINAVFGLGEGLVSGDLNADSYTLKAGKTEAALTKKTHQYKRNSDGGIHKVGVPENLQDLNSLQPELIAEIATILDDLDEALGHPQDIEFAIENQQLYLTQTRPITTLKEAEGEYILWDNSNIVESYPGITTPLTFSFILKMYDRVYRQFSGLMGVSDQKIEKHAHVFAHTLGLVRGRVYYNLLSWYKMLAMLPGYSINAENMERMMGVKERFELEEEYTMTKGLARLRLLFMGLKMIFIQAMLGRSRKQFLKHLNRVMTEYQQINFQKLSAKEIITHYRKFESSLLLKWKAPLINDFFAMIWFGLLEKQSHQLCPEEPNLHNDLLCGSQDIISVEPIHRSMNIARSISQNEEAKRFFTENSADMIWAQLQKGLHPKIKQEIDAYIFKFGERCIGELKLESWSYSQKPQLFVKLIKTYVEQGITDRVAKPGLEDNIRRNAEQKVFEALRGRIFKKQWFKLILHMTRKLVSNRENLRFERTRGFGMVRRMFSALGHRWEQEAYLEDERDIFYLTLEELLQQENQAWQAELKPLIAARKEEFARFRKEEKPMERFYTYGYEFKDEYIYSTDKLEAAQSDLKGIGCCPGVVESAVRVVHDPTEIDSLNGAILVTSSTDPGWVTLFPTASAIIVERGSLLSHSAIVSREMGIPCIVGVTGLLRSLKSGDMVRMDGSSGLIKKIENG